MNNNLIALGFGIIVTIIGILGYALIGVFGQPLAWIYATVFTVLAISTMGEIDEDN